jgi:phosphoglycerol transferase MdoB-like AlkP superfamily enzyme
VIEVQMVKRMVRRALYLAPAIVLALGIAGGWTWALSAAVGIALTIGNLWLAARIIGGIAENNPSLLLVGAMTAFTLGLATLTGIAFVLKQIDSIYFPVTGIVLIASHLVLVLWEGAKAYPLDPRARAAAASSARSEKVLSSAAKTRS